MSLEEESAKGFRRWLKMAFRRLARLEKPEDLEKEIQELIDEGEQRGLISEDEGEMIQGIFSFRDKIAKETMVPRTDVVCAPADTSLSDIIQQILQSGHSRIPIYQESVDNIIGILHAKDLLEYWGQDDVGVRGIVRAPYFIPETKKISDLLRDLRDKKSHMAIVIDEYGGTAGVLTLEDIIEEIIGDIMDEYDLEEKWLVEEEDGTLLVDARLDIEDLEEYLKVDFPKGKFESIGGFVINMLGKVPVVNEKIIYGPFEMVVEQADRRKIEKIRIRRLAADPSESSSPEDQAR